MGFTYEKSTYNQLIDEVLEEIQNPKLTRKTPESFQLDILRAQQHICDAKNIEEECTLRLSRDVDEYFIQDRPPITAITNVSPRVVSMAAHGFTDGDIITQRDIQGATDMNGSFRATVLTSGTYSVKNFSRIQALSIPSVDGVVTVTTEKAHGWETGQSITIENTDLVDGTYTITVTGTKEYTIADTIAEGETYNSGDGLGYANTPAGSAYVSGGRAWKENEIPTHMGRFIVGRRVWGGIARRVTFTNLGNVIEDENYLFDGLKYSSLDEPTQAAHCRRSGQRYLKFHGMPANAHDVVLQAALKIVPNMYFADPVTAYIHLDSEWDEVIKMFMKSRAHYFMQEDDKGLSYMEMFKTEFRKKVYGAPITEKIKVVYS